MRIKNLKFFLGFLGLFAFVMLNSPAQANFNMIKAYKEAYPDAHPKCINCHVDEKPKKDDGQHEWNDYGKAAKEAIEADATAAKLAKESHIAPEDLKSITDKFSKLGSFDDFKKNAAK